MIKEYIAQTLYHRLKLLIMFKGNCALLNLPVINKKAQIYSQNVLPQSSYIY
jgi:hypothetical protein